MAYTWTNSVGKYDEAMSILRAGLEANPTRYVAQLMTFTQLIRLKLFTNLRIC